jgi:hypothetical protein
VPDLDALDHLERIAAAGTGFAVLGRPQVGPLAHADVPGDVHTAQVHVVGVRPGGHAGPPAQGQVGQDRQVGRDTDRAERAGVRTQRGEDLRGLGRARRDRAGRVDELLLLQGVVAAQQHQRELAVEDVDEGLHLPVGGGGVAGGQVLDRPDAGGVEALRRVPGGGRVGRRVDGRQGRYRRFDVGRVAALRAVDDVVLAGVGRADELGRAGAAHRAVGRLDRDRRDAEPLVGADVGAAVGVEGLVQAVGVQVEAVGVLHGELAGPHQARLRPGLVAQLGLELVPHLRQGAVGAELAGQQRDDLFARHAQHEFGALAVLELEQLVAHDREAAAALPDLGRLHDRHHELLGTDPVHLLADDADDLQPHSHRQWQQRVVPRHQLADVPGPQQQAVAGRARLRGVVPQRRDVHG